MNPPSKTTLKKYGLSAEDWLQIYNSQSGKCPICCREFDEKVRPCIDHLHVPRYKKLKPIDRKKYVRGLLCIYDNRRILPKGMTLQRAENIVLYLRGFEKRLTSLEVDKSSQSVPKAGLP